MKYEHGAALTTRYRSPIGKRRHTYSFSAYAIYLTVLALVTGFSSVWWLLSGAFPFGRERAGAWLYWPDVGSIHADPYARAIINRSALLPMGVAEGIELLATRDTAGAALRTNCTYRLGSTAPRARFWTLGAYGLNGGALGPDIGRHAFTSREVIRNEDGRFTITLSRAIEPGNWLPLAGNGNFALVLRLYDVPANGGRTTVDPQLLPAIERVECAP